eukprot:3204299-Rhodomonas_salina.1
MAVLPRTGSICYSIAAALQRGAAHGLPEGAQEVEEGVGQHGERVRLGEQVQQPGAAAVVHPP